VHSSPTIGVLALQGAFDVHAKRLTELGATTTLVRRPEQLAALDGLVIPGGESTTFLKHLERAGFYDVLNAFVHTKPVFGTCAGCILLASEVTNPPQKSFAVLDIAVERNAYGRQNDSAILTSETTLPGGPLEMVFIRAPRITRTGPELTDDLRVHQLFLDMVAADKKS
jgi:5'-phosphate synthase pdxT subunit